MLLYNVLAILIKQKGIGMLYIFHYHGYHNYYSIADMISIHIFLLKSSSPVTELKGFFSNISFYQ